MRALAGVLVLVVLLPAAAAQAPTLYHNHVTLTQDLQALAAGHPDIARLSSLGASVQGRELWVMEVGNFADPAYASLPAFYLDGGHHGNEHLGIEAAYLFLEELLDGYGNDAAVTQAVDAHRTFVAPLINPDGNILDTRTNANLVNLNRNYPFHWDERGTDPAPAPVVGGNYPGESAASEPETQASVAFLQSTDPVLYVSLHTGSFDIVRPFGYAPDAPVPDEETYRNVLDALEAESGMGSRYPNGSGESICYAYGGRAIFSFIIEVSTEQTAIASASDLRQALAQPLAVLRFSQRNAERYGAHVSAEMVSSEPVPEGIRYRFRLENDGFGRAWNMSVIAENAIVVSGERQKITLAPGVSAEVEVVVASGAPTLTITYPVLEIRSEERNNRFATLRVAVQGPVAATPEGRPAPGLETPALLLAIAVVGSVAARRKP